MESSAAISRLDAEQRMAAVLLAVSKLDRREREAIELCVWAELTPEEAARALGISPGEVRGARRKRLRPPADTGGNPKLLRFLTTPRPAEGGGGEPGVETVSSG
jgi:FixJ family two-component response regulator